MLRRINKLPKDIIPLSPPYLTVEEEKIISKVLRSGVLSLGPYINLFEKSLAKFIGTKYAVATSSGTAGLHLGLVAAGIKPGDEVITSPFSFVASANVILYVGAKPVFVDIDPVTLNIDPGKIEAAITGKTKAILPVHIFGFPADYDSVLPIAQKHKLKIVEDAAESIGARYGDKFVGNFGNLAVFAFYANKQITTGEGGMIVCDNREEYLLLKSLVNQGRGLGDQWLAHQRLGFNYRMDEMSAALGYVQMKKIGTFLESRRKAAQTYQKYLSKIEGVKTLPDTFGKGRRSWQTFIVLLNEGIDRDRVMAILNSRKIQSRPYLPVIHLQSYWRKAFGTKPGLFPVAESISRSSLALPLFTGMTKKMIEQVCLELERAIRLVK